MYAPIVAICRYTLSQIVFVRRLLLIKWYPLHQDTSVGPGFDQQRKHNLLCYNQRKTPKMRELND